MNAPAILRRLLTLSRRGHPEPGARSLEVTLVVRSDVVPWHYPPRQDLVYGDWWRREYEAGDLEPWTNPNPDLATLIAQVRLEGRALVGPSAAELLPDVPVADLRQAMVDSVPSLLDDLPTDTRNVLLTLARIWSTWRRVDSCPRTKRRSGPPNAWAGPIASFSHSPGTGIAARSTRRGHPMTPGSTRSPGRSSRASGPRPRLRQPASGVALVTTNCSRQPSWISALVVASTPFGSVGAQVRAAGWSYRPLTSRSGAVASDVVGASSASGMENVGSTAMDRPASSSDGCSAATSWRSPLEHGIEPIGRALERRIGTAHPFGDHEPGREGERLRAEACERRVWPQSLETRRVDRQAGAGDGRGLEPWLAVAIGGRDPAGWQCGGRVARPERLDVIPVVSVGLDGAVDDVDEDPGVEPPLLDLALRARLRPHAQVVRGDERDGVGGEDIAAARGRAGRGRRRRGGRRRRWRGPARSACRRGRGRAAAAAGREDEGEPEREHARWIRRGQVIVPPRAT